MAKQSAVRLSPAHLQVVLQGTKLVLLSAAIFFAEAFIAGAPSARKAHAEPIANIEVPKMRPGHVVAPQPADQWSDAEIAAARSKCGGILTKTNAEFEIIAPIRKGSCGTPAPVKLSALGANLRVKISPPATLNCNMVLALHRWLEEKVQPRAKNEFGARVVEIKNISSYSCRRRYNNPKKKLSEHALANALDIAGLKLSNGKYLSLLEHWGETKRDRLKMIAVAKAKAKAEAKAVARAKSDIVSMDPTAFVTSVKTEKGVKIIQPANAAAQPIAKLPSNPASKTVSRLGVIDLPKPKPLDGPARFLRQLHVDACGIFGTVLGPEANQAHANHFHFDLAPRRRSAYCQ